MRSDIEKEDSVVLSNIWKKKKKAGIDEKYVENYGRYKAKIDLSYLRDNEGKKDGKLKWSDNVDKDKNRGIYIKTCNRRKN